MKILHINAQGVRKKFTEIKQLIYKYHIDIAIINEAKINLDNQKFNILNYDKLYEQKANHLGTIIYIKSGIRWAQTRLINSFNDDERNIEGCSIRVFTNHITGEYITIKGIYVPIPNQNELSDEFEQLLREEGAIIIGDMNLRMKLLGHPNDGGLGVLLRDTHINGDCRIIHSGQPSRPTSMGNKHILDIAITTYDHSDLDIKLCKQIEPIGSDHIPWLTTINLENDYEIQLSRNLKDIKSDQKKLDEFEQFLATKIDPCAKIETDADCDEIIMKLETAIVQTLDVFAPLKQTNLKDNLPEYIQKLIVKRNKAKNLAWCLRFTNRYNELKREHNRLKRYLAKKIAEYREESWNKVLENKTDNRRKMWSIQRAMKRPTQRLPRIENCNTELEIIDNLVNTAIIHVSDIAREDENTEKYTPFHPLEATSHAELKLALRKFKNQKAPGPDGIRADVLKLGGDTMITIFKRIMDYTINTGYFPKRWKESICIFLHKPGKDYTQLKSYRPISLLNIMGKWAERIILSRINTEINELIPEHQHGFVRQRGTGTQILRTGKYISDALEKGHSVAMISTDLSKAFDSINHKGLIKKMYEAGARNNIIKIIENYLSKRSTKGRFRTTTGTEKDVPHGVPQGSILGPVLFNLYVADIPKPRIAGQMLSQYADDLCILNAAEKPDHATRRAEWAAEEVIDYYKRWGLQCNVDKTECIMFSHKRPRRGNINSGYRNYIQLKNERIEYKNQVKYLGVVFDKRLSMNKHTKERVEKLKRVRGALNSIIGYRSKVNIETKLLIIQTCLLPVLDYGVIQLLPRYSKSNLTQLERQYRMALKAAGDFPRRTETKTLWEMLGQDPWHIRAHDLHYDMIEKLTSLTISGLEDPGPAYTKYGQFNPFLFSNRIGDIEYLNKSERGKPLHKRTALPRQHRL